MTRLRDRLSFDSASGSVHDGPRRYLLMRADVLMGALHALAPAARAAMLAALAESTERFGGESLQAYRQQLGTDRAALLETTADAAADLGWGSWRFDAQPEVLRLSVLHSPFADASRSVLGAASGQPMCAPIRGMLQALASLWFGAPAFAREQHCAAQHGESCEFEARRNNAATAESPPASAGCG